MTRARTPRVADATFLAIAGAGAAVHLQVTGDGFVARAVPLTARLGEQVVQRIVLRPDGSGFVGMLERAPREGERLFVGYADGKLNSTHVVYRRGVVA